MAEKKKSPAELKKEGDALKALIAKIKKKTHNCAILVSKDGIAFEAHIKKSPEMLVKMAKKAGGGAKGAWGTITMEGQVLMFSPINDKVPGNLPKLCKTYFTARGVKNRVELVEAGDVAVATRVDGVVDDDGTDPRIDKIAGLQAKLDGFRSMIDAAVKQKGTVFDQLAKIAALNLNAFKKATDALDVAAAQKAIDGLDKVKEEILKARGSGPYADDPNANDDDDDANDRLKEEDNQIKALQKGLAGFRSKIDGLILQKGGDFDKAAKLAETHLKAFQDAVENVDVDAAKKELAELVKINTEIKKALAPDDKSKSEQAALDRELEDAKKQIQILRDKLDKFRPQIDAAIDQKGKQLDKIAKFAEANLKLFLYGAENHDLVMTQTAFDELKIVEAEFEKFLAEDNTSGTDADDKADEKQKKSMQRWLNSNNRKINNLRDDRKSPHHKDFLKWMGAYTKLLAADRVEDAQKALDQVALTIKAYEKASKLSQNQRAAVLDAVAKATQEVLKEIDDFSADMDKMTKEAFKAAADAGL